MSLGGLSEILGMGVTIQLRNMFSVPAMAIEKSSRAMTNTIVGDQKSINNGWRLMAGGASLMLVGTGIMAGMTMISKYVLKASSDLEVFRNQLRVLSHDKSTGDALFEKLKIFSAATPFTIPEVMAAGKNLLAFGFTSDRVMQQLKLTGEWASMMNVPIAEAAAVIGKVRTGGIAMAMRRLQVAGISYKDIADAGGPIDPKTMRTMKGVNPEVFVKALNKVIEQKFAGGMALYMTTLPGMMANIEDQLILASAEIGERLKPEVKKMLTGVLSVFRPELILPFAHAFGDGLLVIVKILGVVLTPLAQFGVWIMQLSKEHPNFVKFGAVAIFVAGALTTLAGAAMVAMGAFRVLEYLWTAEKVAAWGQTLLGLLGPLGWITAAAGLFYIAWQGNFSGIRTVLTYFWDRAVMVFSGVKELLTSISNGVGTMSQKTYDALGKAGLLGVTTQLFMIFYRVYTFLKGVWEGIAAGVKVVAFLGSVVLWVTTPIWMLGYALWEVLRVMGWVGNLASSSVWEGFGAVVGSIATALLIARGAMLAWSVVTGVGVILAGAYDAALSAWIAVLFVWNAATKTATAVQWLFNLALDANPIGAVIMGIALLITLLVVWYTHAEKINKWFASLPFSMQTAIAALIPFVGIPLLLIRYWEDVKSWFSGFGVWLGGLWDRIMNGMIGKLLAFGVALAQFAKTGKVSLDWLTPDPNKSGGWSQFSPEQLSQISGHTRPQAPAPVTQQPEHVYATANGKGLDHYLEQLSKQPVQVQSIIQIDGRTVGRAVTMHQRGETVSGR